MGLIPGIIRKEHFLSLPRCNGLLLQYVSITPKQLIFGPGDSHRLRPLESAPSWIVTKNSRVGLACVSFVLLNSKHSIRSQWLCGWLVG